MRLNAEEEYFNLVKVRGQEMLFHTCRIDRETIPKGWYLYEVMSTDDGWDPATISETIHVNHFGTLLSPKPITDWDEEICEQRHFKYLQFDDNDELLEYEWEWLDTSYTLKKYIQQM